MKVWIDENRMPERIKIVKLHQIISKLNEQICSLKNETNKLKGEMRDLRYDTEKLVHELCKYYNPNYNPYPKVVASTPCVPSFATYLYDLHMMLDTSKTDAKIILNILNNICNIQY
jgi:hypothetical protein